MLSHEGKSMKYIIFLVLILLPKCVFSDDYYQFPLAVGESTYNLGNRIYLEPRFSRTELSTASFKQKGYLYGGKIGYDFICPNSIYFGLESSYMQGQLKGGLMQSTYSDFDIQARTGMTFGLMSIFNITPYIGMGYDWEKNEFSALEEDKISYCYGSVGFLSQFYFACYSLGLNFQARFPFLGSHSCEDEESHEHDSVSKKIQYLIEIPVNYYFIPALSLGLTPFYTYKNYSNSFSDTDWLASSKLHSYGLAFRVSFNF